MGEFFGSIYCIFEDFFGLDLAEYLWGQSSPLQATNMYIGIGWSMLGISLFIAVLYYYIIDHPRLSRWWGWCIFCGVNAIINFFVGWQWVLANYYDGKMVAIDPATKLQTPLPIDPSDILCFGVSNMFLSIFVFFLLSCFIKWGSVGSSRVPF